MAKGIKNVFISHIYKDDAGLGDLKSLLVKNGMKARDYSITSDKKNNAKSSSYIKSSILAPQIDRCSTMIVYITPQTKNSDWVNWEIKRAHDKGKTIVGVWERGSKGCDVPDNLAKYGHAQVGWHGDRIIDAVNGDYRDFTNSDGKLSDATPITRHPCG